jgi:ribose 5-phosphate isomerase B
MEIVLAADHAGFTLKEAIKVYLMGTGYTVLDVGTYSDEPVDYPAIMRKGALEVLEYKTMGIFIGGSGNGEAMAANKVHGIRAALVYNEDIARLARAHNNANVLCIGARFCELEDVKRWLDVFLHTPFDGGRHERRVEDIESEK